MSFDDKNVVNFEDEFKSSYTDYAMSVIVGRAIPDVRDGLKPVHRRVLYAMKVNGINYNKPYKKSARVVGEVMGRYHPHGDSAIYDTMVHMTKNYVMNGPLIDGQGNFGSIDDDPPAAMRYTEVRLSKIATKMLDNIDEETVDFLDNYDGTEREPSILPASIPNLLINGTEGIAVGMATSIPPHNISDVIDACVFFIKNKNCSVSDISAIIKAPDFPTKGIIINASDARRALEQGRGSVIVRGRVSIEEGKGGKESIIVTEMPFRVVKSGLVAKIAQLVREKRLEGISSIRDESSKDGIRVVVELKRDAQSQVILNHLYKNTQLETSVSINMLALHKKRPEYLNVLLAIKPFVEFRKEVVIRRTKFRLSKCRDRSHILIGHAVTVDCVDEIVAIIRSSRDSAEAEKKLLSKPWKVKEDVSKLIDLVHNKGNIVKDGEFFFTPVQAKSILEMRLSKLTGLEKEKIAKELGLLGSEIQEYLRILSSPEEIDGIIVEELTAVKNEFGIPRQTELQNISSSGNDLDFITKEDIIITLTNKGFVKSMDADLYMSQRRGGKGRSTINLSEEDFAKQLLMSNTHDKILFFSNKGQVYKLMGHEIQQSGSHNTKGRSIFNFINLDQSDSVSTMISLSKTNPQSSLVFVTQKGNVRRSAVESFSYIPRTGKRAIELDEDDKLVSVFVADESHDVFIATKDGKAIRFALTNLRITSSRSSDGVRGIKLDGKDIVVSACSLNSVKVDNEKKDLFLKIPYKARAKFSDSERNFVIRSLKANGLTDLLSIDEAIEMATKEELVCTITSEGIGKKTSAYCYRFTGRGGKGVLNIKTKSGVLTVGIVGHSDEMILVSNSGKAIKFKSSDLPVLSRNVKGVKLFTISKKEFLSSAVIVSQKDAGDDDLDESSNSENDLNAPSNIEDKAEGELNESQESISEAQLEEVGKENDKDDGRGLPF